MCQRGDDCFHIDDLFLHFCCGISRQGGISVRKDIPQIIFVSVNHTSFYPQSKTEGGKDQSFQKVNRKRVWARETVEKVDSYLQLYFHTDHLDAGRFRGKRCIHEMQGIFSERENCIFHLSVRQQGQKLCNYFIFMPDPDHNGCGFQPDNHPL